MSSPGDHTSVPASQPSKTNTESPGINCFQPASGAVDVMACPGLVCYTAGASSPEAPERQNGLPMTLPDRLRAIVGPGGLIATPAELLVHYECDGYTIEKKPAGRGRVPDVDGAGGRGGAGVRRGGRPVPAARGGDQPGGGCLPVGGGVVISLARMKRILEVDLRNRYALVEPGVINEWLTNAVKGKGYHFAPDPSSQKACTIGGNVATNSGGPHTLKYGVTVNHVLGVELVLPDGQVVTLGGPAEDPAGYADLTGVVVEVQEGTFGVVTRIWVRLTRDPEATGPCWGSSRRSTRPPTPSAT